MENILNKAAGLALAAFIVSGPVHPAVFGDTTALEPGLKTRADILFFGGFEANPWPSTWGLAWGPEPASQGTLDPGPAAFEGHSLRVKYPEGTFSSGGGLQSLTDFSKFPIAPQESLYLRYYLRFDPGFDFVKGGKLPGLAGGKGNTGGHKPSGTDGWSARVMWRADGKIVQYVYHPDQPGEYGEDFDWNFGGCPRFFVPGRWYCLETYVKMNTPGRKDGVIVSWLDGDKALEVKGLRFRDVPSIRIDKLYFETFFGGGDPSWATPRDQYALFDNFVMAKNYIGPEAGRKAEAIPSTVISPVLSQRSTGLLVFDGEHDAWASGNWSHGRYDLHSALQNHTPGGRQSVSVELPNGEWGAVQFAGPVQKSSDYKNISMWVYPTGCDVEFRIRFELNGTQVGIEKPITPGPRHGWQVGQWNRVEVPLSEFQVPGSFDRIVLNSNSPKAVSLFYLDDILLIL
jgi:hypothetical protein